jgi:hypothetical protein
MLIVHTNMCLLVFIIIFIDSVFIVKVALLEQLHF